MRINDEVWSTIDLVDEYSRWPLREVERVIFERYRDDLGGRVLELGVGTGRITAQLAGIAAQLTGLDINPLMVEECRRAVPGADVQLGDLLDLGRFADASFDALFAGFNVIDVLDDVERARALDEWHRVLAPGGLLVFSSHNLAAAAAIPSPWRSVLARNPVRLARNVVHLPARLRNHRRLSAFEHRGPGWALVTDGAHDYGLLHYYVDRDHQAGRLAAHGFAFLECLDVSGAAVGPGGAPASEPELHYCARSSPPPGR